MARFYASIQGNRGKVTRTGTTKYGIKGHIRGWDIGVEVDIQVNDDGQDEIDVWLTGGSNRRISPRLLGTFIEEKYEQAKVQTNGQESASNGTQTLHVPPGRHESTGLD